MRRIFGALLVALVAGVGLAFGPAAYAGHQEGCSPGPSRDPGDVEVDEPVSGDDRVLYADVDPTDEDGAYVGSDKRDEGEEAYIEVEVNAGTEDTVFVHGENRSTGNDGWVKVDGDGVTSQDCAQ